MKKISYKNAGVDIDKGNAFVQVIKPMVESTFRPEVLTKIGGFAGCVSLNLERYKKPILVSSTDGVGTKLKIAFLMDRHDTVGIDLVAMCVNDLVVVGAKPLFFLDYLATSDLDLERAKQVMSGLVKGCVEAECSLIRGETAEMPGFYKKGEYDLAGFAVGIVEDAQLIDGSNITVGDKLIGIASNGLHSNGFSLVRNVFFERHKLSVHDEVAGLKGKLYEELLRPTRIYVKTILALKEKFQIKGMAHITGGGLPGNVSRIIPDGLRARMSISKGPPEVFKAIMSMGDVSRDEMYATFNMGIGFVLVVKEEDEAAAIKELVALGEEAFSLGAIEKTDDEQRVILTHTA